MYRKCAVHNTLFFFLLVKVVCDIRDLGLSLKCLSVYHLGGLAHQMDGKSRYLSPSPDTLQFAGRTLALS